MSKKSNINNKKNSQNNKLVPKKSNNLRGLIAAFAATFGLGTVVGSSVQTNLNDAKNSKYLDNLSKISSSIENARDFLDAARLTESTIDDQCAGELLAFWTGSEELYKAMINSSEEEKAKLLYLRGSEALSACNNFILNDCNDKNAESLEIIKKEPNLLGKILGKDFEYQIKINDETFPLDQIATTEYIDFYANTSDSYVYAKAPEDIISQMENITNLYSEAAQNGTLDSAVIRSISAQEKYEEIKDLGKNEVLKMMKQYYCDKYNEINNTDLKPSNISIMSQYQVGRCNFKYEDGRVLEATNPVNGSFDGIVIYDEKTDSTGIIDGYGLYPYPEDLRNKDSNSKIEKHPVTLSNINATPAEISAAEICNEFLEAGIKCYKAIESYEARYNESPEARHSEAEKVAEAKHNFADAIAKYEKLNTEKTTELESPLSFADSLKPLSYVMPEMHIPTENSQETTENAQETLETDNDEQEL